jgi:hypothetical protein
VVTQLVTGLVALAFVGCAGTVAPSGPPAIGTESVSPTVAVDATEAPSPYPTAGQTAVVSPTPLVTPAAPDHLQAHSFAQVVVAVLNVRTKPTTSAPLKQSGGIEMPPEPVRYGTGTPDGVVDLYVLKGPVKADGYRWWQVAPTQYIDSNPGWVADANQKGTTDWLVPAAAPCPASPAEVADVTIMRATWAVRLGCFRGETLTFRGWIAWEFYDSGWEGAIFPVRRTWSDPDSIDRLDFMLLPGAAPLPATDQWIEIVGQFDHPYATTSCKGAPLLECRSTFAASSVRALGTQP